LVVVFLSLVSYILHLEYEPSSSFGIVSLSNAPSATLQWCSGHAPSYHTRRFNSAKPNDHHLHHRHLMYRR